MESTHWAWDLIVVTAATAAHASAHARAIERDGRVEGLLLPGTRVIAAPDPVPGLSLGSGGATLNALAAAVESLGGDGANRESSPSSLFSSRRTLVRALVRRQCEAWLKMPTANHLYLFIP